VVTQAAWLAKAIETPSRLDDKNVMQKHAEICEMMAREVPVPPSPPTAPPRPGYPRKSDKFAEKNSELNNREKTKHPKQTKHQ
jgi:hypothetical protein